MKCRRVIADWKCINDAMPIDESYLGMCVDHTYLEEQLNEAVKKYSTESMKIAEDQIAIVRAEPEAYDKIMR